MVYGWQVVMLYYRCRVKKKQKKTYDIVLCPNIFSTSLDVIIVKNS